MLNLFRLSVGIPLCLAGLHLVDFSSRVLGEEAFGMVPGLAEAVKRGPKGRR